MAIDAETKIKLLTLWCKKTSEDPEKLNKEYLISDIESQIGFATNTMKRIKTLYYILSQYNIKIITKQNSTEKENFLRKWCEETSRNPKKINKNYTIKQIALESGLATSTSFSKKLYSILEEYEIKLIRPQTLDEKINLLDNWCKIVLSESNRLNIEYSYAAIERECNIISGSICQEEKLLKIINNYNIKILKLQTMNEKISLLKKWCENTINSSGFSRTKYTVAKLFDLAGIQGSRGYNSAQLIDLAKKYGVQFLLEQTLHEKTTNLEKWCIETKENKEKYKIKYSYAKIEKECGLVAGTITKNITLKSMLERFKIKTIKNQPIKEKYILIKEWLKLNKTDYIKSNKSFSAIEFEKECGLTLGSISRDIRIKDLIEKNGIILTKQTIMPIEEKARLLDNWCKKTVLDQKNLDREYNFSEIAKNCGLDHRMISQNKDLQLILNKYNIKIKTVKTLSYTEKVDILTSWCESQFKTPNKSNKHLTQAILENMLNFSRGTFYNNPSLLDILKKYNIKMADSSLVSKNLTYAMDSCKNSNIKVLNIESLIEYSKDILNIHLSNPSPEIIKIIEYSSDIILKDSEIELLKKKVNEIILIIGLSKAIEQESINEIKIYLLKKYKIYLSENDILSILVDSNINTKPFIKDDIKKRLRYAEILIDANIVNIEYVEILPQINTNQNGDIVLLNKINNTKSFVKLWREYVEFLINNEIFGHIKRGDLDTTGNLDKLIKLHPEYAEAFFLDGNNYKSLIRMGYEGIAALAFTAMNKFKNDNEKRTLSKKFHSTNARCAGFFMWLNTKGLALSHPKYITIYGGTLIIDIINKLSSNNIINEVYLKALSEPQMSKKNLAEISRDHAKNHLRYLFFSVSPDLDALSLSRDEFEDYLSSSDYYANPSGCINHKNFVSKIFSAYGNKMAIFTKKQINIMEYYHEKLASENLKEKTLKNFSILISAAERIIIERKENEGISYDHLKGHIKTYCTLFSFLNTIEEKPSRKELIDYLNPIAKTEYDFKKFTTNKHSEKYYNACHSHLILLFNEIPTSEYSHIYSNKWGLSSKKNNKIRVLIRNGMEDVVYETIQKIALNSPAESKSYAFLKSGKNGEILDTSWWKHDISPVPAMALWLALKIPRRGLHILNLDVNDFLVYNTVTSIDGKTTKTLIGFYFNTDKNRNISATGKDFIPIDLLRKILKPEEVFLIEKYVQYIKDAYHFVPEVEYKSGGTYKKIKPLFPSHCYSKSMEKHYLDSYYNKTLLITQFKIRELSKTGELDKYYNSNEKEEKIKQLNNCVLLFQRDISRKKELPKSIEDMLRLDYSDGLYNTYFKSADGFHNLRGTGATYLYLTVGLSINEIMLFTGHVNDKVLIKIYLMLKEKQLSELASQKFKDYEEIIYGMRELDTRDPKKLSDNFINRVVLNHVNNNENCVDEIYDKLKSNGFMSKPSMIFSDNKKLYGNTGETLVENGLEIASRYHPIGSWEAHPYGICTLKNRCPSGTAGICCKCPHLIFNIYNIEGIVLKYNECMLNLAWIQKLIHDTYVKGDNQDRQNLKKEHERIFEEYIGWWENISMIQSEINSSNCKNLPLAESIIRSANCNLNELSVEFAAQADRLKIKNLTTDRAKAEISNQLLITSLKKNDFKTLHQIATEGADFIIKQYSTLDSLAKKEKLISKYLEYDADENNAQFLINQDNNAMPMQNSTKASIC